MTGLVGRIFREFAITIVIAILASGLVSLTLTPLMCARTIAYRGHGVRKTIMERIFGAVEKRVLAVYGRSLWFFLRHKWVSAVVGVACLGGTFWLFTHIKQTFLPVGDSSFAMGVLMGQEGSSPAQMRHYQDEADKVVQDHDAVRMSFTMTGASRWLPSNMGFLITFLKDPGERAPIAQVSNEVTRMLAQRVPGAVGILTPQPVLEISTGATQRTGGQFAYAISGVNPADVYAAGGQLQGRFMGQMNKLFAGMPLSDMFLNTPNLKVNILREAASTYGVSASRVESLLRNAYSENYVYLVKKPQDQYQVILEAIAEARTNPEDLGKLYVRSDDGQRLIPLSAVATWEPTTGPQSVNHLNQFTSVTWQFNLVPGKTIDDAIQWIDAQAKEVLPPTVRGQFQGEALTFKETAASLEILMVMAVFVMYVILGILYESFLHPLTVLSTLPTALVGGLATLWLFNETASLYAFIGLFMLMGIVKKNGIMIVDFAVQRIAAGETAEQSIHDASLDRFRPILMTTLAAVMGAVPIAIGWGADGGTRRPLGLVIVGGLIVSQLITLYVTPVIYLYMELFQEKILGRFSRKAEPGDEEPANGDDDDDGLSVDPRPARIPDGGHDYPPIPVANIAHAYRPSNGH
jgi:HAE1 family hydrophobic/amphiphilic exporter-1